MAKHLALVINLPATSVIVLCSGGFNCSIAGLPPLSRLAAFDAIALLAALATCPAPASTFAVVSRNVKYGTFLMS